MKLTTQLEKGERAADGQSAKSIRPGSRIPAPAAKLDFGEVVLCQLPGPRTEPAVASTISLYRIWVAGWCLTKTDSATTERMPPGPSRRASVTMK